MRTNPRNPRRTYDENGHEIPPLTLGGIRAMGIRRVDAYCRAPQLRPRSDLERRWLAGRAAGAGRVAPGGIVDQDAGATLDKVRQSSPGTVDGSHQVDLEHALECLQWDVLEPTEGIHAGIVEPVYAVHRLSLIDEGERTSGPAN
jgi:hypothetical protein